MLFAYGIAFRKTHDLYELADRLAKAGISPPAPPDELAELTPYAVEFRYGDEITTQLSQEEAERLARGCLAWARELVSKRGQ